MDFRVSHDLPPVLSEKGWVALDLELFGAEKHKLHRPTTGRFACLSICAESNPNIVYVLLDEKQVKDALWNIRNAVWVFHNASFDITHLRRWAAIPPRKKLWDVMIIEKIMCGGLYDTDQYSLEDIVRRRLDQRMNKEIRKQFEKATSMNQERIEYAANDAYVTLLSCQEQKKEITKKDYKVWTEVDLRAFWPMLEFQGFRLDVEAWKALAIRNEERAQQVKAGLDFNPGSWQQVQKYLMPRGFKKLTSTDEKHLKAAIKKYPNAEAIPYAEKVLEYRGHKKNATTYGMNLIEDFLEDEGEGVYTIRPSWWVVGTEHGRTSCSNPNLQNIPIRETKEFRLCFIARPKRKLVIVDMGQQELRDSAFLSQDKKLIALLQDTTRDAFVEVAKMMYKQEIDKKHPLRKKTKNTVYGVNYGMSASGLAERSDLTEEEAQEAIDLYFAAFPDLYSWIVQQKKKKDYVETIFGRKAWLNPYSEQCERNAINSPISGSAADQMKIALGNIYEKWREEIPLTTFDCVGYIHDELIFDVPEDRALKVAKFVSREMINAAQAQCPGVPFTADYVIADNWSEKE